jgi:hypothetical protein
VPRSAEVDGFQLAYDRTGHFVPLEAPSAFAPAILERCQESERP